MAKCEICNKGVSFGIKVSHSHRRSNKMWKPNIRKVRAIVNGEHRRVYVCTRCLRSGKVERGYGSGIAPVPAEAIEAAE
jgi:large subunit ribosomal protein L28